MAVSRVVVVVPRHETRLHDYLRKSLGCLKDVEVVLDRRSAVTTPSSERRQPSAATERKLLLCSLVHCPAPPPPASAEAPPAAAPDNPHRAPLWPALEQL